MGKDHTEDPRHARQSRDQPRSEDGQWSWRPGSAVGGHGLSAAEAPAIAVTRGAFYFPRIRPLEIPSPSASSEAQPALFDSARAPQVPSPQGAQESEAGEPAARAPETPGPTGSPVSYLSLSSASSSSTAPATVDELLERLLEVAQGTAALLEEEDPDPEKIEALLAERTQIFRRLQRAALEEQAIEERAKGGQEGAAPVAGTPRETAAPGSAGRRKEIVEEIRRLDERCIPLARQRVAEAQGRWEDAKRLRRALIAYGWVDPQLGPRGAFVDVTD